MSTYVHLKEANAKSMLLNSLDHHDKGKGSHGMLVACHYLPAIEEALKRDF